MLDLTLGPSYKVKQWCTGVGELSFRWIQVCIGSPMCRSSYILEYIRFTSVAPPPPPYVLTCVQSNSKSLSWISFKCGTHMYLGKQNNAILR